ncbi:hypothetical protein [Luteimonas sp. FCS-9]|uniref:hypothetical protein n=1 Tax=Luteimonas sp. FCS-9 TaxID=1547516 RepID=UPI00063EB8BF|nr:hypothetical protein [Luteimonas sp. FCS-9]KLJ01424.1 hypothetical protein WQ56_06630 [Luteimonas sp. FCS-9]
MRAWMAAFVLAASMSTATADDEARSPIFGHIEFLWNAPVAGAGARPVAQGLLRHPETPHLACWKTQGFPQRAVDVRLEIDDSAGRHTLWSGTEAGTESKFVRCATIDLAALGVAPGLRRIVLRFDGQMAAQTTIEVAESLASAAFAQGDRMYVHGRTNYPDDLAPADYVGRFVWVLGFGPDGRVVDVQTEVAEGLAATRLRTAGQAAARLYRIGPDPAKPLRQFRQPYDIRRAP